MAVKLKATERKDLRSSATKELRTSGRIPSVVYAKGSEAKSISVDNLELLKTVRDEGRNAVITLEIEGGDTVDVMLHEHQVDPVKGDVIHADFYEIDLKSEMDVLVTLNLTGVAKGVKDGGILQQPFYELDVRAMPRDIPEEIVVDISGLEIGDSISISDLPTSDKYEFLDDAEATVAVLLPPEEEEEETEVDADLSLEPEVVGAEDDKEEA